MRVRASAPARGWTMPVRGAGCQDVLQMLGIDQGLVDERDQDALDVRAGFGILTRFDGIQRQTEGAREPAQGVRIHHQRDIHLIP